MEKSHNPVGHKCTRVLCREDANHLEILPDFFTLVKYELVNVVNYLNT